MADLTAISIKWEHRDSDQNHARVLIKWDVDPVKALAAGEYTFEELARADIRVGNLLAKLAWWLNYALNGRRLDVRYGDRSRHWCQDCSVWAYGNGENEDDNTGGDDDSPSIEPTVVVQISYAEGAEWTERAQRFLNRIITDTADPDQLLRRYLESLGGELPEKLERYVNHSHRDKPAVVNVAPVVTDTSTPPPNINLNGNGNQHSSHNNPLRNAEPVTWRADGYRLNECGDCRRNYAFESGPCEQHKATA